MNEQHSGDIDIPARAISIPAGVSEGARNYLTTMSQAPTPPMPHHDDHPAWKTFIADRDAEMLESLAILDMIPGLETSAETIADVRVFAATPETAATDRVQLDLHGGAMVMAGGDACRLMGKAAALRAGAHTISPDYRMPPEHPFPAPVDDCFAVYRELVERYGAHRIVIEGSSAGGNLAVAVCVRARDEGVALPAGLVLLTPEADLTESGDSFATILGLDVVLGDGTGEANVLYAGGHDLHDPRVSPLFADLHDLPPTILCTGTRDVFLSNTVRMHRALRKAGVAAELHVWDAMPHGGFGGADEDMELAAEVARFIDECWQNTRH